MNAADARAVPTHTDQIVIVDLKPHPRMKDSPELPILEVSIRAGARVRNVQPSGRKQVMAVHGRFPVTIGGKPAVVEYEPDPDLRNTEQVPLLKEGGIHAFMYFPARSAPEAHSDRHTLCREHNCHITEARKDTQASEADARR